MKNKEKPDIFDKIWKFFASVKLAIVVLLLIAITSIIGTILPQESERAIQFLTGLVGDNTAPTVYNIFLKLHFVDMYHSWWFIGLLVLFCINLTVCSIDKFPRTWRLIKTPSRPLSEEIIKTLPVRKETTVKTNMRVARDAILNSLVASKYRVSEATDSNGVQLYTQKGQYTRLGVYIVHLSILFVFIGAIIGARFGFDGFLTLQEGRSSDVVYTNSGKTIPLGFTIKCNWYNTEYYVGTDTPKEFQSELVIIEDGREVLKKAIEVNSPLKYKGITFYQASYGMVPDAIGEFILKVTPKGGESRTLRLYPGESFEIPDTNITGTIVNFSPALGRDPRTGRLTTYTETMANPAVAITFDIKTPEGNNKRFTGWILKRYPETGVLPGGHRIEFIDYWGVEYTGLQVSKDPGVVIIYLACIIMTIGLYISFFLSHKKIWVRLTEERGAVRISLGGSASKNRLSLEREADKILSRAFQEIEGRSKR